MITFQSPVMLGLLSDKGGEAQEAHGFTFFMGGLWPKVLIKEERTPKEKSRRRGFDLVRSRLFLIDAPRKKQ